MPASAAPPALRPFFAAAGEGRLVLPRCQSCGAHHWYPALGCPACAGPWAWAEVGGPARLFTWVRVERDFGGEGAFSPFVVGLVELEDAPGVRLLTRFPPAEGQEVAVGMPLRLTFGSLPGHDGPYPLFVPEDGPGGSR